MKLGLFALLLQLSRSLSSNPPLFPRHFTLHRWEEGSGVQALFAQNKSWEHDEDYFFQVRRELSWHGDYYISEPIHMVIVHSIKNMCGVVFFSNNYLLNGP